MPITLLAKSASPAAQNESPVWWVLYPKENGTNSASPVVRRGSPVWWVSYSKENKGFPRKRVLRIVNGDDNSPYKPPKQTTQSAEKSIRRTFWARYLGCTDASGSTCYVQNCRICEREKRSEDPAEDLVEDSGSGYQSSATLQSPSEGKKRRSWTLFGFDLRRLRWNSLRAHLLKPGKSVARLFLHKSSSNHSSS